MEQKSAYERLLNFLSDNGFREVSKVDDSSLRVYKCKDRHVELRVKFLKKGSVEVRIFGDQDCDCNRVKELIGLLPKCSMSAQMGPNYGKSSGTRDIICYSSKDVNWKSGDLKSVCETIQKVCEVLKQELGAQSLDGEKPVIKVNSKKAVRKTKKSSRVKLDWGSVKFCDSTVLDPAEVVKILVGGKNIFPESLKDVFLDRYKKMQENFDKPLSEKIWKQGKDDNKEWGAGLSLADTEKFKDALLQIGKDAFLVGKDACAETVKVWCGKDGILNYPCVGHDLPIWIKRENGGKGKRIMIVSQDPLRTGHRNGKLLISSPFGFHSADYRDNSTMMKLVHHLLQEGAVVYLTDFMKIFNRHKNDTGSKGKCKDYTDKKGEKHIACCSFLSEDKGRCCDIKWEDIKKKKGQVQKDLLSLYKETLDAEIEKFSPDIIVVLGQDASIAMFPNQHFECQENGKKFNERVLPNPLAELSYDGIKCMICHHPSNLPVKGPVEYYLNPLREMLKIKGA